MSNDPLHIEQNGQWLVTGGDNHDWHAQDPDEYSQGFRIDVAGGTDSYRVEISA